MVEKMNISRVDNSRLISRCLCCGSKNLREAIKFPATPLTDLYKRRKNDSLTLKCYDCTAMICKNCSHLQLREQVEASESYADYIYNSKVTIGLNKEFENYAKEIRELFKNKRENIRILDIGSNDGSFMQACKNNKMEVFGVEPASNLARITNEAGLNTICCYFNKNIKETISDQYGQESAEFDVLTFNNVLANMPSPRESLETASLILRDSNSRIIIQTGYHPKQFSNGLFDYIYHEHYSYFTKKSLTVLASKCGLEVESWKEIELRGGSIRVVLKKVSSDEDRTNSTTNIYERFSDCREYSGLNQLVESSKRATIDIIEEAKRQGRIIIGFGASHSTGMLVHKFELQEYIDYIVDENKAKTGLYMPGTDLQVHSLEDIADNKELDKNCLIVVLAWQYFKLIKAKLIKIGFSSENIVKPVLP